jgi:hypothetical protein
VGDNGVDGEWLWIRSCYGSGLPGLPTAGKNDYFLLLA